MSQPTTLAISIRFLKILVSGMPLTLSWLATSGHLSTSTAIKTTFVVSAASFSNKGASALQGGHQSAPIFTTTSLSPAFLIISEYSS